MFKRQRGVGIRGWALRGSKALLLAGLCRAAACSLRQGLTAACLGLPSRCREEPPEAGANTATLAAHPLPQTTLLATASLTGAKARYHPFCRAVCRHDIRVMLSPSPHVTPLPPCHPQHKYRSKPVVVGTEILTSESQYCTSKDN